MKKKALITSVFLILILALGIQRDKRSPSQKMNQFSMVRHLDIWSFYGHELYAKNTIAIYDMSGRNRYDFPEPLNTPQTQIRKFGEVVQGGHQYNLGENNYLDDDCKDFMISFLNSKNLMD